MIWVVILFFDSEIIIKDVYKSMEKPLAIVIALPACKKKQGGKALKISDSKLGQNWHGPHGILKNP